MLNLIDSRFDVLRFENLSMSLSNQGTILPDQA